MKYLNWIVCGVLFMSFSLLNYLEKGRASYYSSKFEGRRTSSGEVFRQNQLTGAHKSLPFGTMVLIKNVKNDSTVVVKINDRLVKNSSRIIDVSLKAAKQLNFVREGLAQVTIEKIVK